MVARFLANFVTPGASIFRDKNLQKILQPRNFSSFHVKKWTLHNSKGITNDIPNLEIFDIVATEIRNIAHFKISYLD